MSRLLLSCVLLSACGGSSAHVTVDGGHSASDGSALSGDGGHPTSDGGPTASDGAQPAGDGAQPMNEDATALCVKTINDYRATLGLAPYARWTSAETCTAGEAKADSQSGVAHSAFPSCSESAQDECPGWQGPPSGMITQCLAQMWAEGPGSDFNTHGHYINMSSTSYTQVSCGFYTLPDGSVWAAQDFR